MVTKNESYIRLAHCLVTRITNIHHTLTACHPKTDRIFDMISSLLISYGSVISCHQKGHAYSIYTWVQYRSLSLCTDKDGRVSRTKGFFCPTVMPSNPQNGSPATTSSPWVSPAAMETPQTQQRRSIYRALSAWSHCELIPPANIKRAPRPQTYVYVTPQILSQTGNQLSEETSELNLLNQHPFAGWAGSCYCVGRSRNSLFGVAF